MSNYLVTHLDELSPVKCPCGWTRRAFVTGADGAASVHLVEIRRDARVHYHRRMTEIYVVLDGTGRIELDGQEFELRPMTTVYIRPGCRHRAIGQLRILNFALPAFDEADEWFD